MATRFAPLLVTVAGCYHSQPTVYDPHTFADLAPLPLEQWVYLEGAVEARRDDGVARLPTAEERSMVHDGLALANAVLRSDCFKTGVLAARMTHTDDESAADVYATMTRIPQVTLAYDLYDGTAATAPSDTMTPPSRIRCTLTCTS